MSAISLSIALCTYNGAAYLPEQLRSIAEGERSPDELLVCDDASTDATVEIIRRFAAIARFLVRLEVNRENLGSTANFARAIGLCQGTWIALCDQDDVWHPSKLRRLCEVIEREPSPGLVLSDAQLIDAQGRPLGHRLWQAVRFTRREQRKMDSPHAAEVLLRHNVACGATLAFRAEHRELLLPIGEGWVHDAWIALLVAAVDRCQALAEPLVAYRQHPQQQIGEPRRTLYQQYVRGRGTSAEHFLAIAERFGAAHDRLARFAPRLRDLGILAALRGKIAHCRAKAAMRQGGHGRLGGILGELVRGHYGRYSLGWRSLAQDLFL
jgi:glycosyltransferase involved in cell wall biosynthesis